MWSPFKLFKKKNKPITINDEWVTANIKEGDVVCLAAFGSGFTWASALLRW